MKDILRQKCKKYIENLSGISGVPIGIWETGASSIDAIPACCRACVCENCNVMHAHHPAESTTEESAYLLYRCPAELTLIAVRLWEEDKPAGYLLAGPLRTEETHATQFPSNFAFFYAVKSLPFFSGDRIQNLAELLISFSQSLRKESQMNNNQNQRSYGVSNPQYFDYEEPCRLLDIELQLRKLIEEKDRMRAQAYLNHLLGDIYFNSRSDLYFFKARVLELVVLLSRIADPNAEYVQYAIPSDLETTYTWLAEVMHRFIMSAFADHNLRYSETVNKIIKYVCDNYHRKLTLDEIAKQVFLSPSYISSLFKLETGKSLITYVNHVRVEQSKHLLLNPQISLVDIARMCGFEDQGYFTKVFKRETGQTPNGYRTTFSKSGSMSSLLIAN